MSKLLHSADHIDRVSHLAEGSAKLLLDCLDFFGVCFPHIIFHYPKYLDTLFSQPWHRGFLLYFFLWQGRGRVFLIGRLVAFRVGGQNDGVHVRIVLAHRPYIYSLRSWNDFNFLKHGTGVLRQLLIKLIHRTQDISGFPVSSIYHLPIWMIIYDVLSSAGTAAEDNEFRVNILNLPEGQVTLLDYPRGAHDNYIFSLIFLHILQACFHSLVASDLRFEYQNEHLQLCRRTLRVGVDPHNLVQKFHLLYLNAMLIILTLVLCFVQNLSLNIMCSNILIYCDYQSIICLSFFLLLFCLLFLFLALCFWLLQGFFNPSWRLVLPIRQFLFLLGDY